MGTVTEIYDYLRLLFANIGVPHCPRCGREIASQSLDRIVDLVLTYPQDARINVLAPIVRGRKGEFRKELDALKARGFGRARIDGQLRALDDDIKLDRRRNHTIEVVVDRLLPHGGVLVGEGAELVVVVLEGVRVDGAERDAEVLGVSAQVVVRVDLVPRDVQGHGRRQRGVLVHLRGIRDLLVGVTRGAGRREDLEAGARVAERPRGQLDRLHLERLQRAIRELFVLHEDVVPDLDEPVAVLARAAGGPPGMWSPWSKKISVQGPQGPVGPMRQKLSSDAMRMMR